MSISAFEARSPVVLNVDVSEATLSVELNDGRTLTVPTGWYPRLAYATDKERNNWTLMDGGYGIHWHDLDEDISLSGLLAGQSSRESQKSLQKWLATRAKKGRST